MHFRQAEVHQTGNICGAGEAGSAWQQRAVQDSLGLAFVTASGVREAAWVARGVGGRLGDTRPFFPGFFSLPCWAGRGRMFLKICTMSRLMGNMRRELSKPIITSCHVNSILPVKVKQRGEGKITLGKINHQVSFLWKSPLIQLLLPDSAVSLFACPSNGEDCYPNPFSAQQDPLAHPRTWCWSAWCRGAVRSNRTRAGLAWRSFVGSGWKPSTRCAHPGNPGRSSWETDCWEGEEGNQMDM